MQIIFLIRTSCPTFELTLSQAALSKLDGNPAAEEYVEGSLTFEGETISPIGIRYKGSIGAFVNCLSGTDWANPSGSKTCTKLSMKVKINWNGSDQKFFGLKKLQFHSMNLDPSQMRERIGYWLFRKMGVPAPRSVHARLMINGVFSGIYALTEQIDGRFTRHNFEDGKGNLYKEIWPLRSNGQPYSEQEYIRHLKTNEDENPTAKMMRDFALDIAGAEQSELKTVIAKWMKIDEIVAYAVVDRAIRLDDGAFHWYCDQAGCTNHNYFWYEEPTEQTMHLIPWDLDNAFENITGNRNPVTPIKDDWGEITNNCSPFKYGSFQLRQLSAACDKLTAGWASFEDEYQQSLDAFQTGPLSIAEVNTRLDRWAEQIRSATVEADQRHSDALSISEWESGLNSLRAGLAFARNR